MKPFVTIAIPVAGAHAGYLPHALASVRAQTLSDFIGQIIVVNDSGKPIEAEGVKLLETRGQEGAAVARNLALTHTRTPFVTFLDADDLLVNTAVETMLRAYAAFPEASYIYGDGWTDSGDGKGRLYYDAPVYDRRTLLGARNLHNVTTLLPTAIARAVNGFDELIRGWEDWDFYIRLAIAGYCGVKVPSPFILYRLHTGQNRAYSGSIADDLVREVRDRYADFISGKKALMSCCGGDAPLGQQLLNSLPPDPQGQGDALLEFIGAQAGSLSFRAPSGTYYRAANNAQEKFVRVKREDVANLVSRGVFRQVPDAALRAQMPQPDDVSQARKKPDPVGVTVPRMEKADELAARVTVSKPCANCGHIRNFDSADGCQALMPNGKVCGCRQYVEPVETKAVTEVKADEPKPDERRRARPGARAKRGNARTAAPAV